MEQIPTLLVSNWNRENIKVLPKKLKTFRQEIASKGEPDGRYGDAAVSSLATWEGIYLTTTRGAYSRQ